MVATIVLKSDPLYLSVVSEHVFMYIFNNINLFIRVFISFFFLCSCFLLTSCTEEDDSEIAFTPVQIEQLLGSDSTKSWILVGKEIDGEQTLFDDCELENELIFTKGISDAANILVFDDSCGTEKVLDGYWEVINESSLPVTDSLIYLFNPDTLFQEEDSLVVAHDTVFNIIDRITSRFLTISRTEIVNRVPVTIKEDYQVSQ